MSTFNPEPPHVSVGLYVDGKDEVDAFASVCRLLQDHGGTPSNTLIVAPADREFEWTTDLADVKSEITVDVDTFNHIVAGREPNWRATEALFYLPKVGSVVVRYEPATGKEPHPIAMVANGGCIGEPEQDGYGQRQAKATARWAEDMLKSAAIALNPLYGAIGVEETLPSPSYMGESDAEAGGQLFISTRLLRTASYLETRLRQCFSEGKVVPLTTGLIFYDWFPFGKSGRRMTNSVEVQRRAAHVLSETIPRP